MLMPIADACESCRLLRAFSGTAEAWAVPQAWLQELVENWNEFTGFATEISEWLVQQTGVAYAYAPALTLGLIVAMALPVLAVISVIARWRFGSSGHHERADENANPLEFMTVPSPRTGWLEVLRDPSARFVIRQEITRIGRADDNDVQLLANNIHRYHAVVERSPEMAFTIVDVSGATGNGIRVGGEAVATALLRDGDTVDIGNEKLRFRLGGSVS